MPALVTGATGFIGANLTRLLLERGHEVRALVRSSSDRRSLPEHEAFEAMPGDLTDAGSVLRAARGCREIFHVAADYRFWARNPEEIRAANETGTRNVLRAAGECGARRVVYTSTVGTIGLASQPVPGTEETPCIPGQFQGHYKRSKLVAERIALQYANEGLPVVIVNPSAPIGAWDRKPTPTGRIIVDFAHGRIPACVDTGLNFVHVRDVAEGHLLAAQRGRIGERYILGGTNLSLRRFLQRVAEQASLCGVAAPGHAPRRRVPYALAWLVGAASTLLANHLTQNPPAVPLEAVRMSRHFMFFDSSKAIAELGMPQTPIDSAIREALEWFKEEGLCRSR